jgi:TPR repeat protein
LQLNIHPPPLHKQANAQFLLGEAFEFGSHHSLKADILKAITWYSRAALRGHIVAALAMGEILAQTGGLEARPRGVNFEMFGANQVWTKYVCVCIYQQNIDME